MKISLSPHDIETPEIPKTSFFSQLFSKIYQRSESTHQAQQTQEKSSFLSNLNQKFRSDSSVSVSASSNPLVIQNSREQVRIVSSFSKNWPYMMSLIIFGTLFIFLALTSLPFLLIAPYKFSLLFAFGTVCYLSAIALLRNPQNFVYSLLKFDKLAITSVYTLSVCGTFYFALMSKSWMFSLSFAVIQVASLMWLLGSVIPGGQNCVKNCQFFFFKSISARSSFSGNEDEILKYAPFLILDEKLTIISS